MPASSANDIKRVHHNIPQLRMMCANTQIMVGVWGRATGKTELGGWFTSDRMEKMPRSSGAIIGFTLTNLLTKLIPGVIKSWEKYGFKQEYHFWVNSNPPKNYTIPKALRPIQDNKNVIFWRNGSYAQLLSMRGLSNAMESDWQWYDEARFLPYDRVKEILLANRGNASHFGHLSEHGSIMFTTDMPRTTTDQWILDYENQMDVEKINMIMQLSIMRENLYKEFLLATVRNKRAISARINRIDRELNALRRETVFFSRASTLENVHALGLEKLKNMKRLLTPLDFRLSVLNEQVTKVEGGFYGMLDENHHGYVAENESYINGLNIDFSSIEKDCRWDADLLPGPLDISCDANIAINTVVVSQSRGVDMECTINALHVEYPYRMNDLIDKFNRYYKYHTHKVINFYYDHTFTAEGDARSRLSFADEWVHGLEKAGWQVNRHFVGKTHTHAAKYVFWAKLLGEDDPRLPTWRYNRVNCHDMQLSMENTGTKLGRSGFEKDKSGEKNWRQVPQLHQPHFSEALDTMMLGKYLNRLGDNELDLFDPITT